MNSALKQALRPDGDALLRLLSQAIDDDMLKQIAAADYGMGKDEYFAELLFIRDQGIVPTPLRLMPREVITLYTFSEPSDPDWKPGAFGMRGYLMRAFCCAILLKAGSETANAGIVVGDNQSIVQLLHSLDALEAPYQEAALRFFAWRLDHPACDREERPFSLLALLLLALQVRHDLSAADIAHIADGLVHEEQAVRDAAAEEEAVLPDDNRAWLLGLTFYNSRHDRWIAVGHRLRDLANTLRDSDAHARIVDIAERLTSSLEP